MNKTIKGVLAAGTASVLLVGGAGTLAYWNDSATVGGATFTAGDLKLDATSCASAGWTVTNSVTQTTAVAFAPGSDKVVPGDVLKKTCTVGIVAVGKNLKADLGVTGGTSTASTMDSGSFSVVGDFKLGGQALSTITSANTGQSVAATITVTVPRGTSVDNASKLKTINLADYTVTATQSAA